MNDLKYMLIAYKQALIAKKNKEVPVGAVAVRNGIIIAKGYNQKIKKKSSLKHAELVVIDKCHKILKSPYLNDVTIYVTLEPCLMCTGALIQSRVNRLVYATPDSKGGAITSVIDINNIKNINHHFIITSGVLQEECSKLLSDFFKEKRGQI
ncbi:MAG: tRNA adenosine(34) deaminase TadA [Bacillales bacterium]|jgi:tRNA(adenine34) deaminase|nr:tRNA adenosine(34) deaminase TadA [Bacillales bacterium]